MGLISYIKKKKYSKIKWENVLFKISRMENFDKVEALQALFAFMKTGLLDAKQALAAKDPVALPVDDYESFWKLDGILSAHGCSLEAYLNGKVLDKELIPRSEEELESSASSEDTEDAASSTVQDKNGLHIYEDPDEEPLYPDESEEPLIDYATGEIINPSISQDDNPQ